MSRMAYSSRSGSPMSLNRQSSSLTRRPSSFRLGYPGIQATNPTLLYRSPSTEVDPRRHQEKTEEKTQIIGLNNKFVNFINKVRDLEQRNKVLETRLKILLEQDTYKANISEIAAELTCNLRQQVDGLTGDQQSLLSELALRQEQVEHSRCKYEDEIKTKAEMENEFVMTKKNVDEAYLQKVALELQMEDLMGEFDFLKRAYEEEIKELRSQIQNTTVVLEVDSAPDLDMKEVVSEVKAQYEEVVARSREEAEQWHKKKMEGMGLKAKNHVQELRVLKKEVADVLRLIQRLKLDLETAKTQGANLETAISEIEKQGKQAGDEAKGRIQQLEEALDEAKRDMARQIHEYQELMNLKLALDIEIATYRKLLEGEEVRWAELARASIHRGSPFPQDLQGQQPLQLTPVTSNPTPKKAVLIKTVEIRDGKLTFPDF